MNFSKIAQLVPQFRQIDKKLRSIDVIGKAAGGKVTAIFTGEGEMKSLSIDRSLTDKKLIEQYTIEAVNEAVDKSNEQIQFETLQQLSKDPKALDKLFSS